MENNLPKGWIGLTIKDFAFTASGGTPSTSKKEYWENGNVPWINSGTLKDDEIDKPSHYITELGLKNSSAKLFPKQTVVIALTGATTGRIGLLNIETSTNQSVTGIFPSKYVLPKYIFYYLKSYRDELLQQSLGSAQPHINKAIVDNIVLPIAPLPEQKRIVEKLDALMTRINNSKARLEKIPVLLKNFRQSVLAAAVSGELTKEWREEHENLLETKTKSKKKERRNVLDDKVEDYDLYDLPVKWNWKTISDVSDVKGGKRIPKGHQLVSYNTGLPYIKAGDLKKGTVLKDKLEYLLPETQKLIKRYIVTKGDAYITNVGAKIGDAGIIPDDLDGANLTENALKMCNLEGVVNHYLSIWLQSPIAQGFIQKTILSAAQGKLALGRVEVFPIPLPPFEEQKEIVRKVEELFHFADSIEARYQKAKAWFDKLPQSLLAKAFRGELVAQDENDEPASVLLERIKIEKQQPNKTKTAKRVKLYKENDAVSLVAEE